MTIASIKEKLHDFIDTADDERLKAIYTLVGNGPVCYNWADDKNFVAELDEEYKRYEDGIDKGITLQELEETIELRRSQRAGR